MKLNRILTWMAAAAASATLAGAEDAPAWKSEDLIANAVCVMCHKKPETGDQVTPWLKESHSKAFEELKSDKAKEVAAKLGIKDPTTSGKCLQCHSTAYGFTESVVSSKVKVEEGVSCQTCHGPGARYKSKDQHAKDRDNAVAKLGLIMPTEAVCVRCHNDKNPTANPEHYTTKDGKKVMFDYEQAKAKIAHPSLANQKK